MRIFKPRKYKRKAWRKQIAEAKANEGGWRAYRERFYHSKDYQAWRKAVLEEYAYKCAICKGTEDLQVHHIIQAKKNPKSMLDVDNGKVLCFRCHKILHPWLKKKVF